MTPKIAIAGIGNLGWNLSQGLFEKGFDIAQIISSKSTTNPKIKTAVHSEKVTDLLGEIDLLFLCLPDGQIQKFAEQVSNSKVSIVHCSGSSPMIAGIKNPTGVFYPFQTFTKGIKVDWKQIPIFIESENEVLKATLIDTAKKLSKNVQELEFEQRRAVHLSGVLGANFTNHLLYLTKNFLEENDVPFEVLFPLMEETIRKAFASGPLNAQTGPARRADQTTINNHIELLSENKILQSLYAQFSKSLIDTYKK